jgi:DNA-binding NtrC family response regulator
VLKKKITGVSEKVLQLLLNYPWPGNVRELENALTRAAVLADRDVLDLADFPQIHPPAGASPAPRNGSGARRHQAGGAWESADPTCSRPHAYTN